MKELTRFLGMNIYFCQDLNTGPHFHVSYNEHNAVIDAERFSMYSGSLPPRVASLAIEWAMLNQKIIKDNWELHKVGNNALQMIPPLVG